MRDSLNRMYDDLVVFILLEWWDLYNGFLLFLFWKKENIWEKICKICNLNYKENKCLNI